MGEFSFQVHDHLAAYAQQGQLWAAWTALFTCVCPRDFGWYQVGHRVDTPLMYVTAFPPVQCLHGELLAIRTTPCEPAHAACRPCPTPPASTPLFSPHALEPPLILILLLCKLIRTNVLMTDEALRVITLHGYLNERNLPRWWQGETWGWFGSGRYVVTSSFSWNSQSNTTWQQLL